MTQRQKKKEDRRKHLWLCDISCRQIDEAAGHHASVKNKGKSDKPRVVVWVWSQQLSLTGGAKGGLTFFSGQKREQSFKRRELAEGLSEAIPVFRRLAPPTTTISPISNPLGDLNCP